MAIKGKNKSKSRSRAPKRRPAGAPRPVAATSHGLPWYRTMGGQLTAIFVVLAIIGVAMWQVSVTKSDNSERAARQAELVKYTGEVEEFVAQIQQPVREMLGAPFNTANPEAITGLTASTDRWVEELEKTGALVQELVPPEDLVSLNVVIQQAFLVYGSAAKTYALVPDEATNKRKQELLTRASELREEAGRVLGGAIGLLDQQRADAEMRPSGLQLPGQMTPILPTPEPAPSGADDSGKPKKGDG